MNRTIVTLPDRKEPIRIGTGAARTMCDRGGFWFAYENQDLCSVGIGHLKFLRCGPDCTFRIPPATLPDSATEINWRYRLISPEPIVSDGAIARWATIETEEE